MRRAISSPTAAAIGPYSHAIDTEGLLFLSGQTPIDPMTGKLAEGDIREQTKQCFNNLRAVLNRTGLTMDNVQKVNVYLTDMSSFAEMNEIYAEQFNAPYPARTTIGVLSLPLGAAVEIEMIAHR